MSAYVYEAPGGGGSDPYPLYTSFDRNTVPWHVGSGGYGAQVALDAPTLPTTTRSVTVHNTTDFNTEAAVNGTQITIGTGWTGASLVVIDANDIDVIIPSGLAIGAIEIGNWPRTTARARIRIRGSTPFTHSGGRMGQLRAEPGTSGIYTDVVVDGIDMNGDSNFGGGETSQAFRVGQCVAGAAVGIVRLAVLNTRVIAGGYGWLGSAKHIFIGNSNFYTGAATRANVGYAEGWAFRNCYGPITIVDSRIQSTRYAPIRAQSIGNSEELLYIGNTDIVNIAEGQTLWMWSNLGNGPWDGQGGLLEGSRIYTHAATGCAFSPVIATTNVTWAEIKNNTFYGAGNSVFTQGNIDASVKGGGVGTGNTFNTLVAAGDVPAWGGPGDPTTVPLPAGLTLSEGEGVCPVGP